MWTSVLLFLFAATAVNGQTVTAFYFEAGSECGEHEVSDFSLSFEIGVCYPQPQYDSDCATERECLLFGLDYLTFQSCLNATLTEGSLMVDSSRHLTLFEESNCTGDSYEEELKEDCAYNHCDFERVVYYPMSERSKSESDDDDDSKSVNQFTPTAISFLGLVVLTIFFCTCLLVFMGCFCLLLGLFVGVIFSLLVFVIWWICNSSSGGLVQKFQGFGRRLQNK